MLLGFLTIFEATLTLPGIAGIILTVGMAVDANVLIFERIKEELKNEKNNIIAFDSGYTKSRTAILDANVKRVISRYENIDIEQKNAIKSLWELSETYTPSENIFEYTQGIMDLGATICHLRSPKCSICPLNISCKSAFKEFETVKKTKKQKLTKRINFTDKEYIKQN